MKGLTKKTVNLVIIEKNGFEVLVVGCLGVLYPGVGGTDGSGWEADGLQEGRVLRGCRLPG